MDIPGYLSEVQKIHKTGKATEHSYRSALQGLFSSIDKGIVALNEPRRVDCGAPDFLMSRGNVAFGHAEAKDIDKDISALKGHDADQKQRFLKALPNLVYTNCLDFEFFQNGNSVGRVSIADYLMGIQPKPENFQALENHLKAFAAQKPQTITSPEMLAEIMAGKAALVKDVLSNALREDKDFQTELFAQYLAFQEHLIHDIKPDEFADIYAETVAYGMFAARLHDSDLDTFSRQKALDLLPKSNPFLRALFSYIAGPDLDDRIRWIIDDLAAAFQAANVKKLLENFGSLTGRNDPFLHFYETFLTRYNPAKRKARGVWYTPEPVVNFIVRAVDELLRSDFALDMGLADTSKVTIDWDTGQRGLTKRGTISKARKNAFEKKDVHRVQILDPATGTGTFLAEILKQIAPKVKAVAAGMWSRYIETDLIPRLHGFELLMASYAMCHMKLDMTLAELGYHPSGQPPRLSVYLTNSLEEGDPANQTLPFAQWLSNEVRQANAIKQDMPVMCVIGNPPYSIQSGNLTPEQVALIDPYRSVDGVRIKEKGMLQFEKNINNDYIKFIALAEKMILKNGQGILAMITSHGYLKSGSFRGLRHHLMSTFDDIRILDLHGNKEIREVVPDGVSDQNVFDIKQGVSIIIASRTGRNVPKNLGVVKYAEVWGSRAEKYRFLNSMGYQEIPWTDCAPSSPNYTFHPSGAAASAYHADSFALNELFPVYSSGVITARDKFVISEFSEEIIKNGTEFSGHPELSDKELCRKLALAEKKGWDINRARKRLAGVKNIAALVHDITYRPFDTRKILFDESVVWTTARATMDHMLRGQNLALISARSEKSGTCSHFFVSRNLVETKCGERTTQSSVFPLYLYPDEQDLNRARRVNLEQKLFRQLQSRAAHPERGTPDEQAVFDYVYGLLHSPTYRRAYAEHLKIDFPRIPWPKSSEEFWSIADDGAQIRRLHLMEPLAVGKTPYPFEGEGTNKIVDVDHQDGKVWINESQHFSGVPEAAWSFFIGGYQPAQKWLKDRKGRTLSFDEVLHYQKIIKVLAETDRIMGTIKWASNGVAGEQHGSDG